MKKVWSFIASIGIFSASVWAQNAPYFQQEVNYKIDVRLDDEAHILRGFESFEYINNSPDEIEEIYIHLWPNGYKNKKTALAKQLIRMGNTVMYYATEEELGYIDSLAFKVDGQSVDFRFDSEHIDICSIKLPSAIKTGESVVISTPFKVKLPSGAISRLGHIGQSYQITQWYPKPAVYDQEGWHAMPYLTQGEFYSEFGSYEVSITLPENYVVGATGDLQTASEVDWLNLKIKEDSTWIAQRQANDDWAAHSDMDFPASSTKTKTITYKQNKVHDFAWFADKRYKVLSGEVVLPASENKVDVYTMFTPGSAKLWSESIEYMHDAVYYYSLWNGDYPYQQATAVDGTISAGGGMEYPNVTVIGSASSALELETVIMHEVGHNWFYGILGSNERRFAWMDEGLNSYNEQRYLSTKYPNYPLFTENTNKLTDYVGLNLYGQKDLHYFTYLFSSRSNIDQALNVHSAEYSNLNYGAIVYSKSAVFFNYLRNALGDEMMDTAMHAYFNEYKFKHPYPEDFEKIIETTTGQDLDWFFRDVIEGSKELDFKVSTAKTKGNQTKIKVCNLTGIGGPVSIGLTSKAGDTLHFWIEGFQHDTTLLVDGIYDRVEIDPDMVMPEINRQNNYAKTSGLFKKIEPVKFKALGGIENPRTTTTYYLPAIGWNSPSGFMLGASAYNSLLPAKKFSYQLALMYGFKSKSPTGAFKVDYMIPTSQSIIESVHLGLRGKSYANYYTTFEELLVQYIRAEPYAKIYFRPADYSSLWRHDLSISSVYTNDITRQASGYKMLQAAKLYNRLNYQVQYSHPVYTSNGSLLLEQTTDFSKLQASWSTENHLTEKLILSARAFVGTFLYNNSTLPQYNFRMDGQSNINQTDYAFDAELLGRDGNTIFANQLTNTHGAFKVPTAVGQSNEYLMAANFTLSYGRIPFGVFADLGHSSNASFMADAGIYARFTDALKIYLPLGYTSDINAEIKARGWKWYNLIRFELSLDELNLLEKSQRIQL